MVKNLTDLLSEYNKTKLSLINLKKDYIKEYEFWLSFWHNEHICDKTIKELNDTYTLIHMSYQAFVAFKDTLTDIASSKDEINERNSCIIKEIAPYYMKNQFPTTTTVSSMILNSQQDKHQFGIEVIIYINGFTHLYHL